MFTHKRLASFAFLLSFFTTHILNAAVAVTWPPIGGTSYSVPQAGETGWSNLTNYLVALQNAQGTTAQKVATRIATATPITVASSTDTIIIVDLASPGATLVNLPAGVLGQYFAVVDGKGDAATNNITVDPNLTQNINGASTYVINKNRAGIVFAWNGVQWIIHSEFNSFSSGGSVLVNPMTTAGDLIYGGASGVPTRLTAGTTGQVLQTGSTPSWVGTLLMADGTVGNPSYSLLSDPDTGWYSSGANDISLATNGTQRLRVTTSSFTTTVPLRTSDGSVSGPSHSFSLDADTGMFRKGTGNVGFAADSAEVASYGPLGQWTFGLTGSTNAGLTYRFYVPAAASTTPSSVITSPYLEFTSQGTNGVPGLLGNQNGASADSGLMFIGATKDGNTSGDMRFDVRENDNSAFSTLTTNGFRWSTFGTDLMLLKRNGSATIGNSTADNAHVVQGSGASTILQVKATGNNNGIVEINANQGASNSAIALLTPGSTGNGITRIGHASAGYKIQNSASTDLMFMGSTGNFAHGPVAGLGTTGAAYHVNYGSVVARDTNASNSGSFSSPAAGYFGANVFRDGASTEKAIITGSGYAYAQILAPSSGGATDPVFTLFTNTTSQTANTTTSGAATTAAQILANGSVTFGQIHNRGSGNITSGTFTPIVTNTTNITSSTGTSAGSQYSRVGDVVTVSGTIDVTITTAAGTASEIGLSLPIASNFANGNQCAGTFSITSPALTSYSSGAIFSDATNDRARLTFNALASGAQTLQYQYTYRIL